MGGADVGFLVARSPHYRDLRGAHQFYPSIDLDAAKCCFAFEIANFWKRINGSSLICVLAGL